MPIKQIQLRGISRTPSDRAVADGGCAESLNVHLDQQETAPAQMPKNVSSVVYQGYTEALLRFPIVYVHKMRGIENYIGYNGAYPRAYGDTLGTVSGPGIDYMGNTYINATLKHITSIGNILILYTNTTPHYFLFKDNAYLYLGTSIPKPMIEVASFQADNRTVYAKIEDEWMETLGNYVAWNEAAKSNNEHNGGLMSAMSDIWDSVVTEMDKVRSLGAFSAPFFIRYALRLYDGSFIHMSSPILCGGGMSDNWVRLFLAHDYTGGFQEVYQMQATLSDQFTVWLHGDLSYGNWKDLVKTVDIFASTPIYTPAIRANYGEMDSTLEITLEGMSGESKAQTVYDEVMSKGQFYKIMSIDINDAATTSQLTAGTLQLKNTETVSGDLLLEQEDMVDGYRDGIQYIPTAGVMNFNNRLLLVGAKELLPRGDTFLNGQVAKGNWGGYPNTDIYILRFRIVDSSNGTSHYVLAHYYNGSSNLYRSCFHATSSTFALEYGNDLSTGGDFKQSIPYAWISYPDTRCKEVDVFYPSSTYGKRIPLEPHPLLECACAFLGFGVSLDTAMTMDKYDDVLTPQEFSENLTIESDNKMLLSQFENPYLFPAGNIVTFSDKLVGAAVTSVPLSEGQFGEFPMYVFTEGGIRMLLTTHEGSFAANMTPPNLARYVALPDTILGLEQSIVFTTKKGVMLLTGSAVTDISQNMVGRPYALDASIVGSTTPSVSGILGTTDWADIAGSSTSAETLMAFMAGAKVGYDHNGGRLIFFKPGKAYQYVYMLQTQTWHKLHCFTESAVDNQTVRSYTGIDIGSTGRILNSYPECLVSYTYKTSPTDTGLPMVMDFSTVLDNAAYLSNTANAVAGIIATRPFDLGEPDVRKAIRSIRIRGNYNRRDVQYILLGSFDGLHWQKLVSLRGGSYKLFRLVLLTNLAPTERITWIDVDYETRMTNRLR